VTLDKYIVKGLIFYVLSTLLLKWAFLEIQKSYLLLWMALAITPVLVIMVLRFVTAEAKVFIIANVLVDILTLMLVGVGIAIMKNISTEILFLALLPLIALTTYPYTCELLKRPVMTAS
jgi:hypothetical protein